MDPEVIQDLFNRAVSQGYTKTIDEFSNLLVTDSDVLKDNYNYVQSKGYNKSIEDFQNLVGVKKKDDMASDSGDGLSVSPISNPTQPEVQPEPVQTATAISTIEEPEKPEDFSAMAVKPDLIEKDEELVVEKLNYAYGNEGFTFEETGFGFDKMNVTSANGDKIAIDLDAFTTKKNIEEAKKLDEFIKKNIQENINIRKAENRYEENKVIFETDKEVEETIKILNQEAETLNEGLKNFELNQSILNEEKAALDSLNEQQRSQQRNRILKYNESQKELNQSLREIKKFGEQYFSRKTLLEEAIGEYTAMRSRQGNLGQALREELARGIGRIGAGYVGYGIDLMTEMKDFAGINPTDFRNKYKEKAEAKGLTLPENFNTLTFQEIKGLYPEVVDTFTYTTSGGIGGPGQTITQNITQGGTFINEIIDEVKKTKKGDTLPNIREFFVELTGGKNVSEQYMQAKKEEFWAGALIGLAGSIPAFVNPEKFSRVANLISQVSDYYEEEFQDVDLTENEKASLKLPLAIISGVLENIGFRNIINKQTLVKNLLSKFLDDIPEGASTATFRDFVRQQVNNRIVKGGLTFTSAGLAEFETGALQEVSDITGKALFNKLKDRDLFQNPESFSEALGSILRAGAQEAVGGFVLGTIPAISDAYSQQDFTQVDNDVFDMFKAIRKDPKLKPGIVTDLKQKINNGELTKEEAQKQLDNFDKASALIDQIPADLPLEQQKEIMGRLQRKESLQKQIGDNDPVMYTKQLDEIKTIDQEIESIIRSEAVKKQDVKDPITKETSKINTQLTEEQQDIDAFFGDEVSDTTEVISDNLSINKAGPEQTLTVDNKTRVDRVIDLATLGAQSISKLLPNTRIILHESNEEFEKYANPGRAEIIGDTIHINLSNATATTVPHEIFHAVFLSKIKTDPKSAQVAETMMTSVRKTLPNDSDLAKRIDSFAQSYENVSELQNEERLAELIGIMSSEYKTLSKPQKNVVIKFIENLASTFGVDLNISEFTKTDEDVIDLLNTLATKVGTGEEITEVDVEILEDGTNPVGDPTEIRVPKPRQQINFKDSYPLSLVAAQNKIDILSLIKNINSKKEKVWFWVADQLGIGDVNGILLDAGPSFALEGDAVWASSAPVSKIEKNIGIADYLFIISGSPERSLLFNKKVYDVFIQNLGEYSTFKSQALATNPVKNIRETLDEFNSWDDLRNSPKRKVFLNAVVDQATKPNTDFHKLINTLGGFIDVNDLRDGFYKENNFSINDVMLVLKPTGVREGSKHSTYKNEVLGEIVGVPDAKVNAFEIMPLEMVNKYKRQLSVAEQSQIVAPYGSGIREIRQPRQQRSIEDVTRLFNMNEDTGFIPKTANLSELRKAVEPFGFEAFKSREDQFGRGGGLFIKKPGRPRYKPTPQRRRQQKSPLNIVTEGREAGFRDELIVDFLQRNYKKEDGKRLTMKEIRDVMDIPLGLMNTLPQSFSNLIEGAEAGLKLYKKIEAFRKKERANNKRRKNKLSEAQIMDKAIEFMQKQPEYINEGVKTTVKGKTRVSLSNQQRLMEIDLQKSIGQRPTKDMAARLKNARILVRQSVKTEKDLQKIKRQVRAFIRKSLPPNLYSNKEVNDLISKVTLATSKNIENILDEVIDIATTKNNKSLQNKVDNILNGKYETTVSGRRKAIKIDLDTRKRLEAIIKTRLPDTATEEQISERNKTLNEEFEKLAKDQNTDPFVVNKMVDLQIAINLNNALLMADNDLNKTESLDQALDALIGIVQEGRGILKSQIQKQAEEYRRQFAELYFDITGNKLNLDDPDLNEQLEKEQYARNNEKTRRKLKNRVATLVSNIMNRIDLGVINTAEALDGLMDKISSLPGEMFGGRAQVLVTDRIDAASREFKKRKLFLSAMLDEQMAKYLGKNWRSRNKQFSQLVPTAIYKNSERVSKAEAALQKDPTSIEKNNAYTQALNEEELILSQNQMYYLYNQFKDPANRKAFENMYGDQVDRVMQEIENKIDPDLKNFADWQVNVLYPTLYKHYNKTYKQIYRTDLPMNKYYAGYLVRDGVPDPKQLDLLGDQGIMQTAVGSASTKARSNNNLKIKPTDGTSALTNYIDDMEYFSAYAVPVRDINKLFTNPFIRKAIADIHGPRINELIDDAIGKLASRGGERQFLTGLLDMTNSVFLISRLGINPVIMIKQLTSTFTYANDIGIVNWLKYAAKNKTQQLQVFKEIRENSIYMQDRNNNSILRQIENYSEKEANRVLPIGARTKDWIVNFLMAQVIAGDRAAIMLGGAPNYSYYKDQFKKANPTATEQDAIDHAIIKFERDTKRTQQSSDLQDKDFYQKQGPLYRAANMFLTTPKQYLRKEIQAVRALNRKLMAWDRQAGKGTIGENVRTFVMYHIFMPVLFQYVTLGLPGLLREFRDDDDEDLWRAAILGNLNAIFILGEVFTIIGDKVTGKPWTSSKDVGVLAIAKGLSETYQKAVKTKSPSKRAERMQNFYLELAQVTGLPLLTVKKLVNNYSQVIESKDMGETILRLFNFSEYAIKGRQTKKSGPTQQQKREMKKLFPELYDELYQIEDDEIRAIEKELKDIEKEILESLN
tara:strand:- start:99 stop:7814 length:7716 start_codon:yes stop_codon:yes gene_type:complete